MSAIRINGIRVGHQMFHLCQRSNPKDPESLPPVYRILAEQGINLPCLGLVRTDTVDHISCCLEQQWEEGTGTEIRETLIVSVYPHRSKTAILGRLLSLFASENIGFLYMVSSTAMISFVVEQPDKERILDALERTFDLPATHTPYEPGFQEETAAFVKQRYRETRAYFQEQKIKTYGFALETGLTLTTICCGDTHLHEVGQAMQQDTDKFYFATAVAHPADGTLCLHWLSRAPTGPDLAGGKDLTLIRETVDTVSFHGPHFGDRFGIFNAAATCLESAGIDLRLAGCTGASITLVLPAGEGDGAITALEKGFDTP